MRADEKIGTFSYDGLIADTTHSLDVKGVTVASGQGALARGTVLAINEAGKAEIMADAMEADCILTDDVDATAADVYTTAYLSGKFNKDALIVKAGYTLKTTDTDTLRTKGIFVESVME